MHSRETCSHILSILWHNHSSFSTSSNGNHAAAEQAALHLFALLPSSATAPRDPVERMVSQAQQINHELGFDAIEIDIDRQTEGDPEFVSSKDASFAKDIRETLPEYLTRWRREYADLGVQLPISLPLAQKAALNAQAAFLLDNKEKEKGVGVAWDTALAPSLLSDGAASSFRFPYLPLKMNHYLRDKSQRGIATALLERNYRRKVLPLRQQLAMRRLEWEMRRRPVDMTVGMLRDMVMLVPAAGADEVCKCSGRSSRGDLWDDGDSKEGLVVRLQKAQERITQFIRRQDDLLLTLEKDTGGKVEFGYREPFHKAPLGRSVWEWEASHLRYLKLAIAEKKRKRDLRRKEVMRRAELRRLKRVYLGLNDTVFS